jgi:O-antigen/teichoic acid export membrane protein
VFVVISRRLLPGVSFRPRFDWATARQILSFSTLKFFSTLSGQVVFQLDRLLIASFLPLASVTHYAISLSLAQKIVAAIPNVTTAVFPAISQVRHRGDDLVGLYLRVVKLVAVIVLPVAVVLIVFANRILTLWMGSEVATHSSATLRALSLAFLVASYAAVPGVFVEAMGRPGVAAFFASISAVLNVALTLVLIPRMGIMGPAVALFINGLVTVPLFIARANRSVLRISNATVVRNGILKPLLAAVFLFLFYSVMSRFVSAPVGLGLVIVSGGILFLSLCVALGVIDRSERRMVMEFAAAYLWKGKSNAA